MKAGLYRREDDGGMTLVSEHEVIWDPCAPWHALIEPKAQIGPGHVLLYVCETPTGNYLLPWPTPPESVGALPPMFRR